MRGEYLATRALLHAVHGDQSNALAAADKADELSEAAEVRGYTAYTRLLLDFRSGSRDAVAIAFSLMERTALRDPMVTLLRSAPDFGQAAADNPTTRPKLQALCQLIDDRAMARQFELKIRTAASADDKLSPREREVLGLICLGFKNYDIAKALYISESTVKVHVRHIFEKLGVRTRAEAAARVI
jgi:ATP/maltotriose-dependent transcriptional regulator MalT